MKEDKLRFKTQKEAASRGVRNWKPSYLPLFTYFHGIITWNGASFVSMLMKNQPAHCFVALV
jgi:hypothetical protein